MAADKEQQFIHILELFYTTLNPFHLKKFLISNNNFQEMCFVFG